MILLMRWIQSGLSKVTFLCAGFGMEIQAKSVQITVVKAHRRLEEYRGIPALFEVWKDRC